MANPQRTPEFDAFGPWILEVGTQEEVPPLFREDVDVSSAVRVLKVPRSIERRDANPSMDLYDRVLVIRADGFRLLTRNLRGTRGFGETTIKWDDIVALALSTELLRGTLELHLRHGQMCEIPFNAISVDLMSDLVATIRDAWNPSVRQAPPCETSQGSDTLRLPRDAMGNADVGLISRFSEAQDSDPELVPVYTRRRHRVRRLKGSGSVLDMIWPGYVGALIVASSPVDAVLVRRLRTGLERSNRPDLSLSVTYLRRGAVHVEAVTSLHWANVQEIHFPPTSLTAYAIAGDGTAFAIEKSLRPDMKEIGR